MSTATATANVKKDLYRHDGVRITHDPFAPEMLEKYGAPGKTDSEGFDPYADTVGPGIYGGIVKRDATGKIVIGRQYQNHNPRPGPIYAGGGYTKSAEALKSPEGLLRPLLKKFPDLANDVTTGGAQPLHMCGMSRRNQDSVTVLVEFGADLEALDTYGMTPLHRMASNNLAKGAQLLIAAGADPNFRGLVGQTPAQVARSSHAWDVLKVLENKDKYVFPRNTIKELDVMDAGMAVLNGKYSRKNSGSIPSGFRKVCEQQGWNTEKTWKKLNGPTNPWFKHHDNESYIYYNQADRKWWIDGPDGMGVYIATNAPAHAPPAHGWQPLSVKKGVANAVPMVRTFRQEQQTQESKKQS